MRRVVWKIWREAESGERRERGDEEGREEWALEKEEEGREERVLPVREAARGRRGRASSREAKKLWAERLERVREEGEGRWEGAARVAEVGEGRAASGDGASGR